MQALAERLDALLAGATFDGCEPFGFAGLKTVSPPPESLAGMPVEQVGRRGKYLVFALEGGHRILVHLSQAGRVDVESPPKATPGRGGVVRLRFSDAAAAAAETPEHIAVLVREHGKERKARWWVLAPGDEGPLGALGPEPDSDEFAEWLVGAGDSRRVHTVLRDQRTVAGVGRGYADDSLHRARISPFKALRALSEEERTRLVDSLREVLAGALTRERRREGGLSEARLGGHFDVHGKAGLPCPVCDCDLGRVSYESHEIVYCPRCQTGGKVLADRRLSRLIK